MSLEALAAAIQGEAGPSGTPGQGLAGTLPAAPKTRRRVHRRYHITEQQIDQLEGLAAELRAAVTDAGLSATHVARRLGNHRLRALLSPRGIRRNARRPRPDTLRAIAALCGLPDTAADAWAARWPDAIGTNPNRPTTTQETTR